MKMFTYLLIFSCFVACGQDTLKFFNVWREKGASSESLTDIVIGSDEHIYSCGSYEGFAFGDTSLKNRTGSDFYIAKHDKDGQRIWAITAGIYKTNGSFSLNAIALDDQDN